MRIDISMGKLSYLYGARPEHGLKRLCTDWFNCVYLLAICIEQGKSGNKDNDVRIGLTVSYLSYMYTVRPESLL